MNINQTNNSGENKITFEISGNSIDSSKKIGSFEDSDQIREFFRKTKNEKMLAYIFAALSFILAPIYSILINKLFN